MPIKIEVVGLETEEDRDAFAKRCADFWMGIISQKINELPLSYEKKVEFGKEIIEQIQREGINQST